MAGPSQERSETATSDWVSETERRVQLVERARQACSEPLTEHGVTVEYESDAWPYASVWVKGTCDTCSASSVMRARTREQMRYLAFVVRRYQCEGTCRA